MSSLFVFYVNKGCLFGLDFDVNRTVKHLQRQIKDEISFAPEEQLLLTPAGARMDGDKKVSIFEGVGTMNKPVYCFARTSRSDKDDVSIAQQKEKVEREIRAVIEEGDKFLRLKDASRQYMYLAEHSRNCLRVADRTVQATARIVQEHHNLNGGWNALVTNMNETMMKLDKKQKRFDGHAMKLEDLKQKAEDFMIGFDECIELLQTIKLPVSLQVNGQEATLYDWITASDPTHSLKDLGEQVHEQLTTITSTDIEQIRADLKFVRDLITKSDHREIRGINKRIAQIEHSLSTLSGYKDNISELGQSIQYHNPVGMDERVLADSLAKQQALVIQIHDNLRKMNDSCVLFYKSKGEVLENVRTRLNTWVVAASEKLHITNANVVVFDEKFHGLKQRLDLVRQVKETPLMFATCITEIVRRKQLYKEFRSWHSQHTERCHTFSGEENQLRTVFAAKLEKHFLRIVFQGMFDKLPIFFVKHVPDFDQQLPDIDTEYYKDLRNAVGVLESVLRVNSPQVHQRLSGRPSSLVSCASSGQLKREESFISYEQASNLTTNLHNAFPSTPWLADDTMDMSPCTDTALLMMQSPAGDRQRNPFHTGQRLPSLHDIHEHDTDHHMLPHSIQSAPIQIPSRSEMRREDNANKSDSNESSGEGHHLVDSREDREQFPIDDISTRSQVMEVLRPMVTDLNNLNKDLADTRADLLVYKDRLELDVQDVLVTVARKFIEAQEMAEAAHAREMGVVQSEVKELKKQIEVTLAVVVERDSEIEQKEKEKGELRQSLIERDIAIAKLEEELTNSEERLKEATDDIFKKLTIEYELAKDREASEYREMIDDKESELATLKKELERKQNEIDKLKNGPASEEFRKVIESDTRMTLEKEFKTRIDLLAKGFDQKKDESIVRMKKDLEFDHKKREAEKDHAYRLAVLERDLLRAAMDDPNAMYRTTQQITKQVESHAEKMMQESQFSSLYLTSPRQSPRRPTLTDSLHLSITSLTSPLPDSPPEEMAMSPPQVMIPPVSMPKIIAPGDLTPRQKEDSSSSLASEKEDSDGFTKKEEGQEKRGEKRRSTERSEAEGKKTMIMEESFIPGHRSSTNDSRGAPDTPESPSEEMFDDPMSATSVTEDGRQCVSVQTKVTNRAMEFMVSLNDIREGSTVLVVWDDRHNAYILFCISNFIHFVKETSVRRLGLSNSDESNVRKNWVLARVAHVDLCVIKKATNRYSLPVDTQVYRVDVVPVAFDPSFMKVSCMPTLRA